jgi:hypothetical protein
MLALEPKTRLKSTINTPPQGILVFALRFQHQFWNVLRRRWTYGAERQAVA